MTDGEVVIGFALDGALKDRGLIAAAMEARSSLDL